MKKILLIILILTSTLTFCQKSGIIKDSITNVPIPYVNIWIENENIGTTSNENGKFILDNFDNSKVIVFSAIGYTTKKINSKLIKNIVELNPQITELKEVIVNSKKQNKEIKIGQFEKSKINHYFGCGTKPWIVARYFNFQDNYSQTPILKKIKLLTKSDVKNSKFNIRLYSVNEKGEPENYIYNENIIGIALKGKKETEIDISNLNIEFPEKGFFIAIEWLIIDSNKYEYIYTTENSKEKKKGISYEPSIGTLPNENNENSWTFNQGKWRKFLNHEGSKGIYKDKDIDLAIELTLTD